MLKIVAIGGGSVKEKSTLKIDKEIITFSGKKNPKLLFIPTASSDSETYFAGIKKHFESLGCKADVLYLIKDALSKKEIEKKILSSDIIYVWGGNTLKMMTLRRKLGVDKMLEKAAKKWIVLSGLSAGSICRFSFGNSDSRLFTSNSKKLIKVTWLGYINALHCPHYDSEKHRQKDLKRMMKNSPLIAIALEDNCALQLLDTTYRIVSGKKSAKAYKIYWKGKKYYKEEIQQIKKYQSIKELITK